MDFSEINLDDILPHRRRMRLVGSLEVADDQGAVVRVPVVSGSPFLDAEGFLKPSWYVEIVAQAVACYCGWSWLSRPERPGTFGYVVAVDDCLVTADARPSLGECLLVRVRKEFEMPPAGVFQGLVFLGGQELGRARLKTFVESTVGIMGESRNGVTRDSQKGARHGR